MFCSIVLQTVVNLVLRWQSSICRKTTSPSVHFLSESAPTYIWVARSWGLPRSTRSISTTAPSLWHFQSSHSISKDVGIFLAVSSKNSLDLWFRQARTLQASQLVRAWTFLCMVNHTAITRVFKICFDCAFKVSSQTRSTIITNSYCFVIWKYQGSICVLVTENSFF